MLWVWIMLWMGWLFNTIINVDYWYPVHSFTCILVVQEFSQLTIYRAYDVILGEAVCGSPTPLDCALSCTWGNKSRGLLVTTGVLKLNVWAVNDATRKLLSSSCDVGRKKRTNQCVVRVSNTRQSNWYTLLCSITHVETKVHVIFRSFVLWTWMRDTVELV